MTAFYPDETSQTYCNVMELTLSFDAHSSGHRRAQGEHGHGSSLLFGHRPAGESPACRAWGAHAPILHLAHHDVRIALRCTAI